MSSASIRPARRGFAGRLPVLFVAAAAALATGPALAGPLDGLFPDGGPFGPSRGAPRVGRLSGAHVVDLLYTRYGASRVIVVRAIGDVYEADAVDRQGRRVRYVVSAYSGELLERDLIGAYEAPVPLPPAPVPGYGRAPRPGGPLYGEPPSEWSEPRLAPVPQPPAAALPPQPRRERPANRPDGSAAAPARPPVPGELTPAIPTGPSVTPVEKRPLEPPPASTARAPAEQPPVKPTPVPPPAAVAPPAPPPVVKPAQPAEARPAEAKPPVEVKPPAVVKQATPAPTGRIPEPLIDPKTGKPTAPSPSVPVAPLDDAKRPTASTPPVPPAVLD